MQHQATILAFVQMVVAITARGPGTTMPKPQGKET